LKTIIAAGEPALGVWLQLGEPSIAEIASLSGYDFLILDNEHGPASLEQTVHSMRAAQAGRATVMVRVPGQDPDYLKRALDAGAEAVMVPMVETAEQARAVVAACQYPPAGRRGYSAPTVRASGYGADPDYAKKANDALFICVQIESDKAVEQAGAIAAVEGVDSLFIGRGDLTAAFGDETKNPPAVVKAVERISAAAQRAGKPISVFVGNGTEAAWLKSLGASTFVLSSDQGFLRQGALAGLAEVRGKIGVAAES
jgi:4-hydroxy-2-oxoheptanedioate aldolase